MVLLSPSTPLLPMSILLLPVVSSPAKSQRDVYDAGLVMRKRRKPDGRVAATRVRMAAEEPIATLSLPVVLL
jgi:hypothetical protein